MWPSRAEDSRSKSSLGRNAAEQEGQARRTHNSMSMRIRVVLIIAAAILVARPRSAAKVSSAPSVAKPPLPALHAVPTSIRLWPLGASLRMCGRRTRRTLPWANGGWGSYAIPTMRSGRRRLPRRACRHRRKSRRQSNDRERGAFGRGDKSYAARLLEIHDENWLAAHPDLTLAEYAAHTSMMLSYQARIAAGTTSDLLREPGRFFQATADVRLTTNIKEPNLLIITDDQEWVEPK